MKSVKIIIKARFFTLAVIAALAAQLPAFAQKMQHPHIFNIYVSVPVGHGQDVEITAAKIAELEQCGIPAISDYTDRYSGLVGDLLIALTGPHLDLTTAMAELQKAKSCGIDGYTKRATFLGGE